MEVSAEEFKAKCLKLIGEVVSTREPLFITKNGRPVVMIVPAESDQAQPLFGYMAGTATLHGDISAPIDVAWEAESTA